ncbi:MAG: zinc ribbon domain-containing protein [Vicinamibacterales bacterium]|nr:zinc ribbon domain-containing protein [Vicinamibacterales bacterium]
MKRQQHAPAAAGSERGAIKPGHLLLLGVLTLAAVAVFVTRGTGAVNMVSVVVTVLTAGLAVAAAFRTLLPFAGADAGEQTEMLAGRTRAALEREKMLAIRSIKELEFDHAMRKISPADYQEMVTRLRARAAGLIRQLDGGMGYRDLIERDLAKQLGGAVPVAPRAPQAPASGTCPLCAVANDADARFCKSCGTRLGEGS